MKYDIKKKFAQLNSKFGIDLYYCIFFPYFSKISFKNDWM